MASISLAAPKQGQRARRDPWMVPGAFVAAVGGALMLAVCNALVALMPGYADAMSTAELAVAIGENPGFMEAIIVTGLLSIALLVPGIWAVAARLAPRSPRLAAIGGWTMATGYIFAMINSTESLTLLLVTQSGLDVAAYGEAIDSTLSWITVVVFTVFGFGALGGAIVLGVAMLRQRDVVPAGAGWLLLAAEPVRVIGLFAGIAVGPTLASLLIAVAFAVLLKSALRPAQQDAPTEEAVA